MDESYDDAMMSDDESPSRRFRKIDLLVLALEAAYNISAVTTGVLAIARNLAGMHANYVVDQANFHREAALEIETLIAGEDNYGE